MGRGGAGDLAGDAAEAFLDELLEGPAGAVAGEHGEVVQVDVGVAVGVRDLVVVDLGEPVVGGERAGVGEDEAADGVGDGGVFLHAPVVDLQVVVDGGLEVDDRVGGVAEFFALAAVKDVGFRDVGVAGLHEHGFDAVLNVFNGDQSLLDLGFEFGCDLQRQEVDDGRVVVLFLRFESHLDRVRDLLQIEVDDLAVAFLDLIHGSGCSCLKML